MAQIQMRSILSNMKTDLIKALLITVANNLYQNPDLELAIKSTEMEAFIKENNIKLPFLQERLAGFEAISLYKKICTYSTYQSEKSIKIKKKDALDLLIEVFENDELFEMLALMIMPQDTESLMNDLGCGEKYRELKKDSVFCARKEYIVSTLEYYHAAVNLYGVIHIADLAEIIEENEHKNWKNRYYQRAEGFHSNTVLFSPEFYSEELFGMLAEACFAKVPISFDGFLLHESFGNQCIKDNELLEEYMEENEGKGIDILESFLEKESKAEFRELYYEAYDKPRYLPEKQQFLKYADDDYMEITPEITQMKIFLKKNYPHILKDFALQINEQEEDILEDLLFDIREAVSSNSAYTCMEASSDFVQEVFEILQEYGIQPENIEESNRILQYIMNVKNAERMWINGGFSPKEMMKYLPKSDKMTIVPGSSQMAELLKDSQKQFANSNIHVDLDSNAVEIPAMLYPNGIQSGNEIMGMKKVYPNDSCPCGSGKKFKKCCGKR